MIDVLLMQRPLPQVLFGKIGSLFVSAQADATVGGSNVVSIR